MDYVIILTHTQIEYDSRIRRQLTILSKKYNIILCCKRGSGENFDYLPTNIKYFFYEEMTSNLGKKFLEIVIDNDPEKIRYLNEITRKLDITMNSFNVYEAFHVDFANVYKRLYDYVKMNQIQIRCIIANDIFVLPMAIRLRNIAKTIYPDVKLLGDMHEFHFDYVVDKEDINQKIRTWLCDTFLPKCDIISSVSEWGAKHYSERYKRVPVICIRNVAEYHDIQPKKAGEVIRLVHVGNAQKVRKIEEMVKLMNLLDSNYSLDLYLISSNEATSLYIRDIKNLIQEMKLENRVRILDPVVSESLVSTVNQYDIGIFYIEPMIGNHEHILPNKLFEYIQGRVAVVTTPVYSMQDIIDSFDVGKVSNDYRLENFAEAIKKVSENLDYYKDKSDAAAKILNTKNEWNVIINYLEQKGR